MQAREKQGASGGGKQPKSPGSWIAGLVIGITVSNLAAGAMMLGTTAAIGKAVIGKPPTRRG